MKMTWRQRRAVFMYLVVDGLKKLEDKDGSQISPRSKRRMTVNIKLRKYRTCICILRSKNVIKRITISFTVCITNGRI